MFRLLQTGSKVFIGLRIGPGIGAPSRINYKLGNLCRVLKAIASAPLHIEAPSVRGDVSCIF